MEKFSELKKLEKKELLEKVSVLRKESLNLRFQKSSGQLEKTARVRQVKKQIGSAERALFKKHGECSKSWQKKKRMQF